MVPILPIVHINLPPKLCGHARCATQISHGRVQASQMAKNPKMAQFRPISPPVGRHTMLYPSIHLMCDMATI